MVVAEAPKVKVKSLVNSNLSIRERIMIALQEYGTQTVHCTLDDLIGKTGLTGLQVYQGVYGMQKEGRMEILTEPISNTGKKRFSGVFLKKIESAASILERVPERVAAKTNGHAKREESRIKEAIPTLSAYMDQKIVVDRVNDELSAAGIDRQVDFPMNQFAEEGLVVLNEWVKLYQAYTELAVKLETTERERDVAQGGKQPIA